MKKRVLNALTASFSMLFLLTSCSNSAGEQQASQKPAQTEAAAPLPSKDSAANAKMTPARAEKEGDDDDEKDE